MRLADVDLEGLVGLATLVWPWVWLSWVRPPWSGYGFNYRGSGRRVSGHRGFGCHGSGRRGYRRRGFGCLGSGRRGTGHRGLAVNLAVFRPSMSGLRGLAVERAIVWPSIGPWSGRCGSGHCGLVEGQALEAT